MKLYVMFLFGLFFVFHETQAAKGINRLLALRSLCIYFTNQEKKSSNNAFLECLHRAAHLKVQEDYDREARRHNRKALSRKPNINGLLIATEAAHIANRYAENINNIPSAGNKPRQIVSVFEGAAKHFEQLAVQK